MTETMKPTCERLVTADDLDRPGSPYERGELWDGVWVVHDAVKGYPNLVESRLAAMLHVHVAGRRLGWITGSEAGFHVRKDPDRVLVPDVAFTSIERLPVFPAQEFVPLAPDFVVEVRSKTDRWESVIQKAGTWLGHGSRVAWVVDPFSRCVAVLRPGAPAETVEGTATVDAAPVLPEFRVTLADLFADLP